MYLVPLTCTLALPKTVSFVYILHFLKQSLYLNQGPGGPAHASQVGPRLHTQLPGRRESRSLGRSSELFWVGTLSLRPVRPAAPGSQRALPRTPPAPAAAARGSAETAALGRRGHRAAAAFGRSGRRGCGQAGRGGRAQRPALPRATRLPRDPA